MLAEKAERRPGLHRRQAHADHLDLGSRVVEAVPLPVAGVEARGERAARRD